MTHSVSSSVRLITHYQTPGISDSSVITHHYITQHLKELSIQVLRLSVSRFWDNLMSRNAIWEANLFKCVCVCGRLWRMRVLERKFSHVVCPLVNVEKSVRKRMRSDSFWEWGSCWWWPRCQATRASWQPAASVVHALRCAKAPVRWQHQGPDTFSSLSSRHGACHLSARQLRRRSELRLCAQRQQPTQLLRKFGFLSPESHGERIETSAGGHGLKTTVFVSKMAVNCGSGSGGKPEPFGRAAKVLMQSQDWNNLTNQYSNSSLLSCRLCGPPHALPLPLSLLFSFSTSLFVSPEKNLSWNKESLSLLSLISLNHGVLSAGGPGGLRRCFCQQASLRVVTQHQREFLYSDHTAEPPLCSKSVSSC